MMLKYSRQREAIRNFLMTRQDHPTADMVYSNLRSEFPNISLGTVYRNLTLLTGLGEIARLRMRDGVDHYDYNTTPHHHFICTACGDVSDFEMNAPLLSDGNAFPDFDGTVEGQVTYFYGLCPQCARVRRHS